MEAFYWALADMLLFSFEYTFLHIISRIQTTRTFFQHETIYHYVLFPPDHNS